MGEKKQRQRSHQKILKAAKRCVYCASTGPLQIEHMPPIGIFKGRDRPNGWVFAACERCNNGTSSVDAVAQMFSMVEPAYENTWKITKFEQVLSSVAQLSPEVIKELKLSNKYRSTLYKSNGLLQRATEVKADGPEVKRHLDLFSEKFAMAAFMELCGRPIEMSGIIFTEWHLNRGMPLDMYQRYLSIMPSFGQLKQGRKVSRGQFSVNYNTDELGIIAAVSMFQSSLTVVAFATDDPKYIEPLKEIFSSSVGRHRPTSQLTPPGLTKL